MEKPQKEPQEGRYAGSAATAFGTYYPNGYVVAVLEDQEGATAAAGALQETGFGADEVRVWTGPEVLANHEEFQKRRGPLQRLGGLFASDEKEALDGYIENARQGHAFVTVHAPGTEEMERARGVLAAHRAHNMHHYGPSVMTDLSSHPSRGPSSG